MPTPATEAASPLRLTSRPTDADAALRRRVRLWLYFAFGALALMVLVQGAPRLALLLALLSVAVVEPIARAMLHRARLAASAAAEMPPAAMPAQPETSAPSTLLARLQQALDHASRHGGYGFALLLVAVDTVEADADDALLQQVQQRLQRLLRPGDSLAPLARPDRAGSEHAVVLDGVNSAERLATIAERVLKELAEPYLAGSVPLRAQVRIGAVLQHTAAPPRAESCSAQVLLCNARTALHEARIIGRNQRGRWLLFEDSMHDRAQRALALETELRRALASDELLLLYQPLLDLRTRRVVGVEALLGWRHPERGLLLLADFGDAAEACGLMPRVVDFVLQQACMQFVQWRQTLGALAPPQLAITLSCTHLQRAGVAAEVAVMLQRCAMQPAWLQLGLKPGMAAPDAALLATLVQLQALGIRLALDDFGSGAATLASLQQWPVHSLRINPGFVQQAQDHHRVLVEATARVAHTLGMLTVAEGIESDGQAALMLSLQCDQGQGALFCPPLAADALQAWLRDAPARSAWASGPAVQHA